MWFVGLIVGAVIGAVGDFQGAILGAIVGAFAGALASGKLGKCADDTRIATLEDAVRQLNERLKALEHGGVVTRPDAETAASAAVPDAETPAGITLPVLETPLPAIIASLSVADAL